MTAIRTPWLLDTLAPRNVSFGRNSMGLRLWPGICTVICATGCIVGPVEFIEQDEPPVLASATHYSECLGSPPVLDCEVETLNNGTLDICENCLAIVNVEDQTTFLAVISDESLSTIEYTWILSGGGILNYASSIPENNGFAGTRIDLADEPELGEQQLSLFIRDDHDHVLKIRWNLESFE